MTIRKILVSIHCFNLYCRDCTDKKDHEEHLNGWVTVQCATDECGKRDTKFKETWFPQKVVST